MEIRQLITFKNVAELNSFSKAAKKLNYGQSTVTEHVQTIEREIGVPLFDRMGKKIALTSVGKELYTHVIALMEVYDKIVNVSNSTDSFKGEIGIGISESLISYRLQPTLLEFRRKYPNVKIKLTSDNCSKLKERLYNGEFDFLITLEPYREFTDLVVNKINEEPLTFIRGNDSKLEKFTMIKDERFINECILFTDRDCQLRKLFENYLYNKKITTDNTLEFSSVDAIKHSVSSNLGISLLPYMSVKDMIEKGVLKVIENDDKLNLNINIIYHKNKWISPVMKEFIEYFVNSLEKQ
ncbi:DNA-binding transcriptional regulator, LysR family [Dethiosulfatibacter aminovorans DSM 17477]|uniref:DNA-binding transcriptional regulator, LysR family n=1 Tax=Dethiosulfatibacter aminovorans DSM 17477 TaxID=1121476 RepID=A0A1M6HU31_9FIRM|nr:LysR family transcriptional regulator [Dethiosulfatibacter aminovorans]SHJ25742.1 DNA-binding transcriptional regulator, LysR family [Dethiosulfatibacter aminovorans DSM 17477]